MGQWPGRLQMLAKIPNQNIALLSKKNWGMIDLTKSYPAQKKNISLCFYPFSHNHGPVENLPQTEGNDPTGDTPILH